MTTDHRIHKTRGALLFWFATLGGAIAWILHLGFAWGVTETTCLSGHSRINGIPFTNFIAFAVVIPAVVALAASVTAWRAKRNTNPHGEARENRRLGRAHLVVGIGLYANVLFLAIIVFDGVALLVFPSCVT
jgi:hypothetical protein